MTDEFISPLKRKKNILKSKKKRKMRIIKQYLNLNYYWKSRVLPFSFEEICDEMKGRLKWSEATLHCLPSLAIKHRYRPYYWNGFCLYAAVHSDVHAQAPFLYITITERGCSSLGHFHKTCHELKLRKILILCYI